MEVKMKFNKKIIAALLLGLITVSSIPIESFNTFAQTTDVNKSKIENNTNDIQDIISSGDYKSIKKINLDSSGKPISSEHINQKQAKSGLSDGLYTIDRGDGWVLGKDKGFIKSIIVPSGTIGILSTIKEIETTHTITKQTSTTFGPDFLKMTIKAGFGISIGEGKYEEIYKTISAPADKNIFAKVQETYRRFEIVRVKRGNIIDSAIMYQPTAHAFKSLEFKENERVNQSKLYEKFDNCILGDPGYDIKGVIDKTAAYHPSVVNVNNYDKDYFSTNPSPLGIPSGAYFTVPVNSKYEIRDTILFTTGGSTGNIGINAGMALYKVNSNNDNEVEFIKSIPSNFILHAPIMQFKGDPLTVDLKAGEKYLLMSNEDRIRYWENPSNYPEYRNAKHRYEFKKVR
jgi:hypothetical protein